MLRLSCVLLLIAPLAARAQDSAPPFSSPIAGSDDSERSRAVGCLAQAIVYEAGLEPVEGQEAVAQVVMNRLRAPTYPKSVCGVVYQGSERRTGCQFTFTCDGSLRRKMPDRLYLAARAVAESALDGTLPDRVGGATNYHAYYVSPYWAPSLTRVGRIGAHIFYRGGGGASAGNATLAGTGAAPAPPVLSVPVKRPAPGEPFSPWGLSLPGRRSIELNIAMQ